MFEANVLAEKAAFIAGGTSGINREIAAAFVRAGAQVAVLSRKPEKVEGTVDYLRNLNPNANVLGFAADVRDYNSVDDSMRQTAELFGPLDIVVSGAAGLFIAPAEKMSANAFKTVVDIDLLGTFNVLRSAYEHARKPGASFINISAPQAFAPWWGQVHACAAKAGVNMLTQSLAFEWASHGIRVNAIVPGVIGGTEGVRKFTAVPALKKTLMASVPLGREGSTADIAQMAIYLASDLSSYMTGEIVRVDGGQLLSGGLMIDPAALEDATKSDQAPVST
jgi:NAD(P)-dependent dehydrogenase (short-subunit alcohol dehydrogenase family)